VTVVQELRRLGGDTHRRSHVIVHDDVIVSGDARLRSMGDGRAGRGPVAVPVTSAGGGRAVEGGGHPGEHGAEGPGDRWRFGHMGLSGRGRPDRRQGGDVVHVVGGVGHGAEDIGGTGRSGRRRERLMVGGGSGPRDVRGRGGVVILGRLRSFDHDAVVLLGEEAEDTADADLLGAVDLGAGADIGADLVEQDLDVGTLKRLERG
jgi:hypothetical protein